MEHSLCGGGAALRVLLVASLAGCVGPAVRVNDTRLQVTDLAGAPLPGLSLAVEVIPGGESSEERARPGAWRVAAQVRTDAAGRVTLPHLTRLRPYFALSPHESQTAYVQRLVVQPPGAAAPLRLLLGYRDEARVVRLALAGGRARLLRYLFPGAFSAAIERFTQAPAALAGPDEGLGPRVREALLHAARQCGGRDAGVQERGIAFDLPEGDAQRRVVVQLEDELAAEVPGFLPPSP